MKTAFLTGGGGGIGAETARQLQAAGFRVGIVDFDGDSARRVAADVPGSLAIQADVSDESSMRGALAAFGDVPDVLVNNAGIVRLGPFLEQSPADLRRVIDVNLIGTMLATLLIGGAMAREKKSGVIINVSSVAGITGGVGTGAYAASKAGVAGFTEQMAVEFGPLGVRVNAVAPGMIDSGMGAKSNYARVEAYEARGRAIPSGRLGRATDIAAAIVFLASDAASYINGHVLVVDGALTRSVLAQLPR